MIGGAYAQARRHRRRRQRRPTQHPRPATRWPKTAQLDGATYTIYQPQLDSWDNVDLAAHAAVSVQPPGDQTPVFGVLKVTAKTQSRQARADRLLQRSRRAERDVSVGAELGGELPAGVPVAVDQGAVHDRARPRRSGAVGAQCAEPGEVGAGAESGAAVRLLADTRGAGHDRRRPGVAWRAGNLRTSASSTRGRCCCATATRSTSICSTASSGAPGLAGPWKVAATVPPGIAKAAADLGKSGAVDLMEGPADEKTGKKPSLASGVPGVIVVTKPTELIVTDGAPDWVGLDGTGSLLYVKNTDANVFTDMDTSQNYVLVSGRWFASKGLNGPWSIRRGEGSSAGVREDPRRQPEGEREGVDPRHGAGEGSADRDADPADRAGRPREGDVLAAIAGRARHQADRRHATQVRRQFVGAADPGPGRRVVRARRRPCGSPRRHCRARGPWRPRCRPRSMRSRRVRRSTTRPT